MDMTINQRIMKLHLWAFLLWIAPAAVFATPDITVHPTFLYFGEVLQLETEMMDVTVTNVGDTDDLDIANIPTINLPFAKVVDNCSDKTLAVNASCTLTVSYTPDSVGIPDADTPLIPSNDPDEAQVQLQLEGIGANLTTNRAPISPVLLTPIDGAMDLDNTSIDFTWERSTDTEGDSLTYILAVCPTLNFEGASCDATEVASWAGESLMFAAIGGSASFMMFGMVVPFRNNKQKLVYATAIIFISLFLASCGGGGGGGDSSTNPGSTNLSETSTVLSSNTPYYWKVTVFDGATYVDSEVRSFTTLPP
jgi:hypothetical protein